MSFAELASRLNGTGGPIVGRATVNPGGVGNAFGLHIVTLMLTLRPARWRYSGTPRFRTRARPFTPATSRARYRVERARHRLGAERGILLYDDGTMEIPHSWTTVMPTSLDLPMLDTVIVEVANPGHPYGVRGVGEVSIVAAAGRGRQRHIRRHRSSHDRIADVAGRGCESAQRILRIGVASSPEPTLPRSAHPGWGSNLVRVH